MTLAYLLCAAFVAALIFSFAKKQTAAQIPVSIPPIYTELNDRFEATIVKFQLSHLALAEIDNYVKRNQASLTRILIQKGWMVAGQPCAYVAWRMVAWEVLEADFLKRHTKTTGQPKPKATQQPEPKKAEQPKPVFREGYNDYCKILGVTPDTPLPAIKRAYIAKIRKVHPDALIKATAEQKRIAALQATDINRAYTYIQQYHKK